jgi:hypothetical protein
VQINHAYAVLFSSQFQRFCRDLHTEAVQQMCSAVPAWSGPILRARLLEARKLDTGNPNPGNIGSDFRRLGFDLWPLMRARSARSDQRKARLEQLNRWRNAIAHQDFSDTGALDLGAGRVDLWLADVKAWRAACDGLAVTLDEVVYDALLRLAGPPPW